MIKANITKDGTDSYYALVVRIDEDGYQHVLRTYKGRYFKTRAAAEKSTARYIAKVA